MNKCYFCPYSVPTKENIIGVKCTYNGYSFNRESHCIKAIETMKEYNNTRSKIIKEIEMEKEI